MTEPIDGAINGVMLLSRAGTPPASSFCCSRLILSKKSSSFDSNSPVPRRSMLDVVLFDFVRAMLFSSFSQIRACASTIAGHNIFIGLQIVISHFRNVSPVYVNFSIIPLLFYVNN